MPGLHQILFLHLETPAMSSIFRLATLTCFSILLAGCEHDRARYANGAAPGDRLAAIGDGQLAPTTAAEYEAKGTEYIRAGLYGLAEEQFRKSVELNPRRPEAWLGLAAAYDNLRRFDLADRAYRQVRKLLGPSAEVLNNEGYSQLMRGNLRRARQLFERAYKMDPNNPVIQRNLARVDQVQGLALPPVR